MTNPYERMVIVLFLIPSSVSCAQELSYPETRRVDHWDTYHDVRVHDPYRWLEQDVRESEPVRAWVEAQNEITFGYLKGLPRRAAFKQRLTELWDYEKYGTPFKVGSRYFMAKNDGLQNHSVIYWMDTLAGPRHVLFNPNAWSEDGTVALGGMSFSQDGRYVAYGIQDAGSDWRTWKVRDIATGQDLPDTLKYLKFTSPAWDPDSLGFFYAKYPDPDSDQQFQSLNTRMKVMYHRLGTQQAEDVAVFYRPDMPEWGYQVDVTDDGRYLIITIWKGTDAKYRVMVKDLQQAYAMPVDIISEFSHDYSFIDNDGPLFYFRTDDQAPRGRIIAIDIRKPQQAHWREIIPQARDTLQGVSCVNNLLLCRYLEDVTTQVRLYTLDGRQVRDIELPGLGTASGFGGKRTDTETFYAYQSFAAAPSIHRYDMVTGASTLLERAQVAFAPDDYVTKQVFYKSKDGTRVPMFITQRKDLKSDTPHPTLLYGYGGFNISILPRFSVSRLTWMEQGGVYAVANLRGGGEYGRQWHEAGKQQSKQNVFDDFIAAAEYLIQKGYTSKEKLAIMGGSNGGLLVGACMIQRPGLFGAAVPAVGVMDMLRFDEFTAGRFWVDDYGSAKTDKSMFEYLRGYSPYHTLRPAEYPATLITTADTDDRVVPGHSFKFAAQLQHVHQGDHPVLIRIETRAGHGSGKPTAMIIEEHADVYAFLAEHLGM